MKLWSTLAVVVLFCACSPVQPDTLYDDGNQGALDCPDPGAHDGPGLAGDPCNDAADDCETTCCVCPSNTDSFLASECSAGFCTDGATACNDAPSAEYCN